jgi:hypothetical protein
MVALRVEYGGDVTLAAAARLPVALLTAALFATGCTSGSKPVATPTQTPVPTPTCPSVVASPSPTSAAAAKALRSLPFDLPLPPHVSPIGATTTADGVKVVRFTTPSTLRDAVLFILQHYQKAGYVIGRGDAEATEADAPWVHTTVRGLTRVAQTEQCQTLWLVAVVNLSTKGGGTTSPLLSPHPTSRTTSALPFG